MNTVNTFIHCPSPSCVRVMHFPSAFRLHNSFLGGCSIDGSVNILAESSKKGKETSKTNSRTMHWKHRNQMIQSMKEATNGPSQTNAVHVACMMSHVETIGQNVRLISNHILPIPVICLLAWHSFAYSEGYSSTADHSLPNGCSHIYLYMYTVRIYLPYSLAYERHKYWLTGRKAFNTLIAEMIVS